MEKQREEVGAAVELISKELVKPMTTKGGEGIPDHPKTHALSIFDQLVPPFGVPIIFFYRPAPSPATSSSSRTSLLKASLAATLYDYYPLAGRMGDGGTSLVIDCNDEGALFLEARVGSSLSEFLRQNAASGDELLDQLFVSYGLGPEINSIPLAVKVTSFGCGATAVCASFAHRVLDMAGFSYFLGTWAAKAAGVSHENSPPEFNLGALYPPANNFPAAPTMFSPPPGAVSRPAHARIVFGQSKVEALKQAAKSEQVQNPTTAEAVTALISVTAVKSAAVLNNLNPSKVTQPVNLRGRVSPPLGESAMGNFISHYAVTSEAALARVVSEIRKEKSRLLGAVQGMDKEGLRLREIKAAEAKQLQPPSSAQVQQYYTVGSWCRFGLYDTDFGWGNPVWVVPGTKDWWNTAVLLDKPRGDGLGRRIEVAFTLDAAQMNVFLRDQDLLAYGLVNPNALDV
ncbi:unnamed protein product [Linum trigynum]|uniref:Transferase n=1 Tax=Linum trigynum TaxID=586398 RepID=A0AAV2DK39_9ROSI